MNQITHPPAQEALQHLEELYSDQELRLLAERRERAIIDDLDARAYERQAGLNEGKTNMLTQQLARKFGALPTDVQQRLASASQSDLDTWALNVLDAATLEGVFE